MKEIRKEVRYDGNVRVDVFGSDDDIYDAERIAESIDSKVDEVHIISERQLYGVDPDDAEFKFNTKENANLFFRKLMNIGYMQI